MKLEARHIVPPAAATLILILILSQTRDALTLSGAWRRASAAAARAPSPFATLERALADPAPSRVEVARDPLRIASAPQVVNAGPVRRAPPRKPAPPPQPVLTSIIFDADPRATVRWDGRDYSVRAGALFADFRVVSIARGQVVLEHGGESMVLRLPKRGESE